MRSVETSGRTVEDAKIKAARELGVPAEDIEFEVLEVGQKGVFGFLGGTPAKVRATYYETRRTHLQTPPEDRQGFQRDDSRSRGRGGQKSPRGQSRQGGQGAGRASRNGKPVGDQPRGPRAEAPSARDRGSKPQQKPPKQGRPQQGRPPRQQGSGQGQDRRQRPRTEIVKENMEQPVMQQTPKLSLPIDQRAQEAAAMLQRILDAGEFDSTVKVAAIVDDGFEVEIEGGQAQALVGSGGHVLDALQFLVGVMANRRYEQKMRVTVEAAGYRRKHRETLEKTALELAEQVIIHDQEAELEPLPARDRLIIHNVLKDHPKVYTYSEGEGENRHVIISPKREEPAADDSNPAGES